MEPLNYLSGTPGNPMTDSYDPVNLAEFEALARQRVSQEAWDYVAGGADDEITLRENIEAYRRIKLRPRMLIDVSTVDPSTSVLGTHLSFPALVAPTALQNLAHRDGELATARAAAAVGIAMTVSTLASYKLEEVAAAAEGPKWFQLYCYREREVTERLVRRAETAGYQAICMTVDVPRLGRRERDLRNEFALPPHTLPRNFEDVIDLSTVPTEDYGSQIAAYVTSLLDGSLTWDDVEWLRSITTLPVLLKGILTAEDAALAVEHGVDGIVVSNHGGRQLDTVPAGIEVLEEIVQATAGKADVLVDGGIRRGTDVVKALALGAKAVMVGRPVFWGLGAGGERGVRRVLEALRDEVELALALCGCPSVGDVTRAHVRTS